MKITLIAKNYNYCNKNLAEATKKNRVELNTVDFKSLDDALNINDWGDVILWRSSSLDNKNDRHTLYEYLRKDDKIIFNLGQSNNLISSKCHQQNKVRVYCESNGNSPFGYINTFKFSSLEELKESEDLMFPVIEKPDKGAHGKGVELAKDVDQIVNCDETKIYQNFIPNDGDYRVMCLGGTVLGIIKRVAKKGDFRNNISQGGEAFVVNDPELIEKLTDISLRISSIFNLNFCGVDIIYDRRDGEYKFLEVNDLVWWKGFSGATGIDVGDKIIKHCIDLYNREEIDTVELVQSYYDNNFDHLYSKKFHFASRMYLFFKDYKYKDYLLDLEREYIGIKENETEEIISKILKADHSSSVEHRKEKILRAEVIKNYPNLRKYNRLLFKFLFAFSIYNKNISSQILRSVDIENLTEYYNTLYSNPEHLCKLSTPAVNYIYNINYFLKHTGLDNSFQFDPSYLIDVGVKEFNGNRELQNKFHTELYYYTHLIIGASAFYSQKINENKGDYIKAMQICEKIIQRNYFDIKIDNKVEFLVCAKLLDYETDLFEIIYSECKNSLSDVGNFLVDKHNSTAFLKNKNIMQSEHTNVLFLMAFKNRSTPYRREYTKLLSQVSEE
ncbi:MAG: ATP-grasp domain-containing protein [Patescibacteria group bacterium]